MEDSDILIKIAKKHDPKGYYGVEDMVGSIKKYLAKGIEIEMKQGVTHEEAKEIALIKLMDDINFYK